MRAALLLLTLCCAGAAQAQDIPYSLATVPEALKAGAAVVVHTDNTVVEVSDLDKMKVRVNRVFTVVNEEGAKALLFNEYTTKHYSLDEAEIKVYNAAGKQVAKYKKKDMTTVSVGEGLIEDGFVTYLHIPAATYPVTVEFNYEQTVRNTLFFPDYHYTGPRQSVVKSSFTATVPSEIPLRYKWRHIELQPIVTEKDGAKTYIWNIQNLPAVTDEPGSSSGADKFPFVSIAAEKFSHYGFKGDLSSWNSFGLWIKDLYNGLDALPAERQAFFQKMVADAPTNSEKARRIYQYLQSNFRYVSIQMGIGGLRPFSAEFTDQKKYGDCKSLSNYMKAALQAVGIRSHVAIINAQYDQEPVDPLFPTGKFNHVILCVPGTTDSVWLECTSNSAAFGSLGTFTENRNALLITESGGVLVPTPKSSAAANRLTTRSVVKMDADLSAVTETSFTTKGEFEEIMADVLKEKTDDQKETLVYSLGYRQPDDFRFAAGGTAAVQTQLTMVLRKLPEFGSGDKFFVNPRIGKVWSRKMPPPQGRKLDFYFRYPFVNQDTTVIQLPAGFSADVLPPAKTLTSPYADYSAKYWYNAAENAVYTATSLTLHKHKVAAADYAAVKTFFDGVSQDYTQKVVLKRSNSSSAPTEKKAL